MELHQDEKEDANLWEQAFESLESSDKDELGSGGHKAASDASTILKAVADKRSECEKKQWVLFTNKEGKKIRVRDVMDRVTDWINHFVQAGDAAVQFDPTHAALPWAGVRLLLQLAINDCQIVGSMLESVETVSSIIARYTALQTRVLIRDSVLTRQLSVALVQLYVAVLRFLAHAHRYYAKSTFKRALNSTINTAKSYVEEPMLAIEKREADVYKLVILVQNECVGTSLETILENIKQNSYSIQVVSEDRRRRLSSWINGIDTRDTYETALRYHHDGTCDWAIELQEFRDWWQCDDPSKAGLLWIHGPAGFGKTFISAWIVRHLKQISQQLPLAFFFCVADNQATRDPYAILRSWLTQILQQDDTVFRVMNAAFTAGDKEHTLTHLELWELFVAVGSAIPGCTFVVDGFDECADIDSGARYHHHDPRNLFLRDMIKYLPRSKSRVLVVSRDAPDIREILGKSSVVSAGVNAFEYQITIKDTTADVKSFTEFVINEKLPKKKETLRQEIADQAAERSEGMFLWIKLLESEISPGQNAKQLRAAVKEMPSGISEAYSRELEKIVQLSPNYKDMAVMILRWVLFAARPLLVKELAEALIVSDEGLEEYPDVDELPDCWDDGFVDEDYVNEMILGRCGSLLQLRQKAANTPLSDHTIHFVHFSVKEYISKLCNSPSGSVWASTLGLAETATEEIRISNICLRYLSLDVFEEVPQDTSVYPFLSYASWAWYFHSFHKRSTPPSQDILERTQKAFDPTVSRWKVWTPLLEAELAERESDWDHLSEVTSDSDESEQDSVETSEEAQDVAAFMNMVQNPIYYASLLGLIDVVKWLADQDLDCNCVGGRFGFPLQAAVARNQDRVVRYLLDRNVNVLQEGGLYSYTIIAAAAMSSLELVSLLLDAGADPTVVDDVKWTALHYAARRGAVDITKCLLDHGAQIDSVTLEGVTPTYLACYFGHKEVLSVLIARGAHLELADKDGVSPLQNSMWNNHEDMTLELLDHLSFTNTVDVLKWGPLHVAVRARSAAIIKKLLDKGLDVEMLDENNWTALQLAAAVGYADAVQTLISAGADIAYSHAETIPPLHIAAGNNHIPIIKLLFEKGADVNQGADGGSTPLMIAVSTSRQEALEALLDIGASMQCMNSHTQQSLFDIAVEEKQDEVTKLLIARGCFRPCNNAMTEEQKLANLHIDIAHRLSVLSYEGDLKTVEDFFADTNGPIPPSDLNESLHAASARGSQPIVKLLLAHGASPKTRDINGRTALHYATRHNHQDVADILIDHGADPLAQDDIGSTPIDLAVCHGTKAAAFIRRHMNDLTLGITRRPSLLEAVGTHQQKPHLSSQTIRKLIAGQWTGHYEYLSWQEGQKDSFSIQIPPPDASLLNSTFSSEHEHDEVGDFEYHGFVDQLGCIWFVKLYEEHGWLYRGQLDAEKMVVRGTWGSNRKLWFGTFALTLGASS